MPAVPLHPISQLVSRSCCGQRAACMLLRHILRPAWSRHPKPDSRRQAMGDRSISQLGQQFVSPHSTPSSDRFWSDGRSARVGRQGVCQFLRHLLPHNAPRTSGNAPINRRTCPPTRRAGWSAWVACSTTTAELPYVGNATSRASPRAPGPAMGRQQDCHALLRLGG
jgi:hypothetical protein